MANGNPFSRNSAFNKDWSFYSPRELGETFFNGFITLVNTSLQLYDPINFFKGYTVKDTSVLRKQREINISVFTLKNLTELKNLYEKVSPGFDEIAVFILVQDSYGTIYVKLDSGLLSDSAFNSPQTLRATPWNLDSKKLEVFKNEGLSVRSLLTQLNKERLLLEEAGHISNLNLPKPKPKLHLTVGMFFDGTCNNRHNSDAKYYDLINAEGLNIKEGTIPPTSTVATNKGNIEVDADSSYWNPYSNIALMHDLYREENTEGKVYYDKENINVTLKQYVEGIGTQREYKDDVSGYALGEGPNGIIGKVVQGCNDVAGKIKNLLEATGAEIATITFDVFGFSRGAAAARHFCNEILREIEKDEAIVYNRRALREINPGAVITDRGTILSKYYTMGLFGEALKYHGASTQVKANSISGSVSGLKVRFLGLFDTVVSQMIIKDNLGVKLDFVTAPFSPIKGGGALAQLTIDKVKHNIKGLGIERILHLTAADEWRENFALTPVEEGCTIEMPGAHSDIGGGYAAMTEERNILDYFVIPVDEEPTAAHLEIMNYHLNKGYCTGNEIAYELKNYLYSINFDPSRFPAIYTEITEKLYQITSFRKVVPRLSLVAMHMMQEASKKMGVPFVDYSVAKDVKHVFEYILPAQLEEYNSAMNKYAVELMEYQYNNHITTDEPVKPRLTDDGEHKLKNKFIHLSAHYNSALIFGESGMPITGYKEVDKFAYVNHPAPLLKRQLYV